MDSQYPRGHVACAGKGLMGRCSGTRTTAGHAGRVYDIRLRETGQILRSTLCRTNFHTVQILGSSLLAGVDACLMQIKGAERVSTSTGKT